MLRGLLSYSICLRILLRLSHKELNGICDLEIKEATDNDSIIRGRALIAPGNKHCLI